MKWEISELKKRWQIQSVLEITLESARVAVALLRREGEGSRRVHSLSLPLEADAVLADPEKAGRELAALLEAAGIRERRCVVCIPPGWALTASADLPGMDADDLRGYLELRAEREFPIPVADLRLAHSAYVLAFADGERRATIAGIPAKRIQAVEQMLAKAGGRIVSLSLGLDACIRREVPVALHFLANGSHVDVVVSAGNGIVALRSLPAADAVAFSREIRITLGRLPETMRRQLCEAQITGAPASAEGLYREVQLPLKRLGIESRLVAPGKEADRDGAAEKFLRQQPVAFEFVAPQVNRWQALFRRFDSGRRRQAVIGAVALIVLPLLLFAVRSSMESRLDAEWEGMRKKVADLETMQQKIRQFRPWFDTVPQKVQTLDALTAAFPDQGSVWAKSVQIDEGAKVTCSGFARTQPDLMSLLDRLRGRAGVANLQVQQVRGENPVQFTFTYKWEASDAK